MPNYPRVLVDVDGVIANFVQLFANCAMATKVRTDIPSGWYPEDWDMPRVLGLTKSEEEKVYTFLGQPGKPSLMAPLPGAVAGVNRLAKISDVYFVTTPLESATTWVFERNNWLDHWFGPELGEKVVHTRHKFLVRGDVLIDDKRENCESWSKSWPNGITVQFHPAKSSWKEIETIVAAL